MTVTTPAPAPAPPPPVFKAGHYVGQTQQNESITFDVASDGIRNFQVTNVNAGCTPAQHLYGGQLNVPYWTINSDGSFRIAWSGTGTIGTSPPSASTFQNLIEGHVQGSIAAGDFKEDTQYSFNGTSYSCTSGTVTWTASLSP